MEEEENYAQADYGKSPHDITGRNRNQSLFLEVTSQTLLLEMKPEATAGDSHRNQANFNPP